MMAPSEADPDLRSGARALSHALRHVSKFDD